MLADGAVLHILDYLRFDCPENQGSYITIEALSRYVTNQLQFSQWRIVHVHIRIRTL